MAIKDKVVSFYVKNFIIPRAQCFDSPGHIYFHMSGKTNVFTRQVIMPETLLNILEEKIREKKGKEGQSILYSIGKKFGYRFSLLGGFNTITDLPANKFLDYFTAINKFIEGTYASEISHEVDLAEKIIRYRLKNFVVCSKVGPSFFLPLGAAAGMASMIFKDVTIEGLHLACQNKGDECCELIYAPISYLKKKFPRREPFVETNLNSLEPSREYATLNQVYPIKNSIYSFKDYLNANLFDYHLGIITHKDQRYFILEVSAIYLLERELEKAGLNKILFDSAFETGHLIVQTLEFRRKPKSVIDLLSAFGFGDVLILKKGENYIINIDSFPFTKFYKEINFDIVRGLLSGMLSAVEGKQIVFSNLNKKLTKTGLSLAFN